MKRLLIIFKLILLVNISICQNLPVIIPATPNAAAMEQYGDYPVSPFSGVTDISIPIYEIKSRHLSMPITLSYHASGIKVTDVASWAGLGWSLNVGGQITRRVMGIPDESPEGLLANQIMDADTIDGNVDDFYLDLINYKTLDQEADIYSYQFPGKSGKFIFAWVDGIIKPIMIPYEPIEVKYSAGLNSFTLRDEEGNQYLFDKEEDTENNALGTWAALANVQTGWALSKITSVNGTDIINLYYTGKYGQTYYDIVDNCSVVDKKLQGTSIDYSTTNQYIFNNEQELDSIVYATGKVVFETDQTQTRQDITWDHRLKYVKIYSKTSAGDSLIKTVEFAHSYFYDGVHYDSKRLKLDYVKFRDYSGNIDKEYKFDYNSTQLPSKTSRCRDYWGYYNTNIQYEDLIPRQYIQIQQYSGTTYYEWIGHNENRDPNPAYAQACILNKITFPTGGYTEFYYEGNKYYETGQLKNAGGVRIFQVKSYAKSGDTPKIKTYKYGAGECGYGRLNSLLNNSHYVIETQHWYETIHGDGYCNSTCNYYRLRSYLANSTIDLFPWDQVPVCYTEVTEYYGDNSNNTGKIIYQYNDIADIHFSIGMSSEPKTMSNHWRRGQLTEKKVYKIENSIAYPVQGSLYSYGYFLATDFTAGLNLFQHTSHFATPDMNCCCTIINGISSCPEYIWGNYDIVTGDNKLLNSNEVIYRENDTTEVFANSVSYQYNNTNYLQVTHTSTNNSKGQNITTDYTYPDTQGSGAPPKMWDPSNQDYRHMHSQVIKKETRTDGTLSAKEENQYMVIGNSILNDQSKYYPSGTSEYIKILLKYDTYDNIIEAKKENDSPISYIWGYNYTLPVAKIDNAARTDIDAVMGTSFNSGNGPLTQTQENTLRNASSLSGSMISTYSYARARGIAMITDPSLISTYYAYDAFGRLSNIKDFNADILKRIGYNISHLDLSASQLNYQPIGGSQNINISTNKSWTITDNASWITESPLSGNYDGTISVTTEQNANSTARSGTVTVTTENFVENVAVYQNAAQPISISPTTLHFTTGGQKTAAITSDVQWSDSIGYYSGSGWLMVSPSQGGAGNVTLNVIVTSVPPTGQWSADVRLSAGSLNSYLFVTVGN